MARRRATENLRESDARYLVTGPGQRFTIRFRVHPTAPGTARIFLFASQGYHIEWIRGDWLIVLLVPVLLVSAGLLGCPVGPSVKKYPPAHTPFGVTATLAVGRNSLIAELLEVRDSGLVVLHERQIVLVPYNAIKGDVRRPLGDDHGEAPTRGGGPRDDPCGESLPSGHNPRTGAAAPGRVRTGLDRGGRSMTLAW